ncbi:MAG: diguanylate cyclase domain-containing protein [Bacillota bacterium]
MKKSSSNNSSSKSDLRNKIIGLGENSFKKSYYPELQERLEELEQTNSRIKSILNALPDTCLLLDKQGRIIEHYPSSTSIDALINEEYDNIKNYHDQAISESFMKNIKRTLQTGEPQQFDVNIVYNNQKNYYNVRTIPYGSDEVLFVLTDVTERYRLIEELKYLNTTDTMTGLYNRDAFEKEMNNINQELTVAIAICDVDDLKNINDTYGHIVGDEVIKLAADIISVSFAEDDFVARIGGDEFGIIVYQKDKSFLKEAYNNIKSQCKKHNQQAQDSNVEADGLQQQEQQAKKVVKCLAVNISIGYAHSNDYTMNAGKLFSIADKKMYKDKMGKSSKSREREKYKT